MQKRTILILIAIAVALAALLLLRQHAASAGPVSEFGATQPETVRARLLNR